MINKFCAKRFCKDDITKIENYEKAIADNKMWQLHHRLETHFSDGTERPKDARLTSKELITLDAYYNRPADELIFMTEFDHKSLHYKGRTSPIKGKKLSDEAKQKMSKAHKGKKHSEEAKQKMSELHKGEKNPMYGKHWKTIDGKRVYF